MVAFLGRRALSFFKPVFNLADMSITIGVLNILLFQRGFFAAREGESPSGQPLTAALESSSENTLASQPGVVDNLSSPDTPPVKNQGEGPPE